MEAEGTERQKRLQRERNKADLQEKQGEGHESQRGD